VSIVPRDVCTAETRPAATDLDGLGLHVVALEHDPDRIDQLAHREGPIDLDDFPHPERWNQEAESPVAITERVSGFHVGSRLPRDAVRPWERLELKTALGRRKRTRVHLLPVRQSQSTLAWCR
jgi:hypothetical protein